MGERGQAASEYVALVALVAVVLALATGLTSGGLGGRVLAGVQAGLCAVGGQGCGARAAADELPPCLLAQRVREERMSETIASVRLATGGALIVQRTSDGRVTVVLASESGAGAEVGLGATLALGGRAAGGGLRARGELAWSSGRAWTFASAGAARRFVARHAAKATIRGKLLDGVRSRCSVLCDALGWRPHPRLPEPDEVYEEGTGRASLLASLGGGELHGEAAAVLGRRTDRQGERTWYLRLGAGAGGQLARARAGVAALPTGEAVLLYRADAHGRPRQLALRAAGEAEATARGGGPHGLAAGLGAGRAVEVEATLDLRDRANRAVALPLLRAVADPRSPGVVAARAAALGARIARHAQIDRRVYALHRTSVGVGASLSVGIALGGAFERTTRGLRLLHATTRLPGLPFLPRDDCRPR